jgi:hypothetical protein
MANHSSFNQQNSIEILSDIDYNHFKDGATIDGKIIKEHHIGNLDFPSGKVIACDPAFMSDAQAYTRTTKPGSYPLTLYTAGEYQTNILAKITFSNKPADKWVLAYIAKDTQTISDRNIIGIAVDTGQACIVDETTRDAYTEFVADFIKSNPDYDLWNALIDNSFRDTKTEVSCTKAIIPNTQHSFFIFTSGRGDGTYPAYWGMTNQDEVVSLVVDFGPFR